MNDLVMSQPNFSRIASIIVSLEHQRYRNLKGSTLPWLFFDLKEIMLKKVG